ncbi:MAG: hypothetical protein AAGI63_11345 [Planctomycetota bacterium]
MNQRRRRLILSVLCVVLAVFCTVAVLFRFERRYDYPLTPNETELVGGWRQFTPDGNTELSAMTFHADRQFSTDTGQFKGFWWIEDGQLNLRTWQDDASPLPLADSFREVTTDTIQFDLQVSDDRNSILIALPRAQPDALLRRKE